MLTVDDAVNTLAPGQWRVSGQRNGTDLVRVTFAGARDIAAVRGQLANWQRALERVLATEVRGAPTLVPLLLPRIVRHETGGPAELRFTAPASIGDGLLSADRSTADVLRMLATLAAGLDALHERQFIHGGLGLESLWWMHDGSLRFPDAGLTHVLDGLVSAPKAAAAYVAPEVWRGGVPRAASDQYALAVIAHELFTGRRRAVGEDEGVLSVSPVLMQAGQQLYPGARPEMRDVLQRAMSALPESRFASCMDFVDALALHATRVDPLPSALAARSGRAPRSGATVRVAALALVTLGATAGAGWLIRESVQRRGELSDLAIRVPRPADGPARPVAQAEAGRSVTDTSLVVQEAAAHSGSRLAASTATLRFPDRSDARYYVDGVLVQPVKGLLVVAPGEHEVDVVVPNQTSTRRRIVVRAGETADVPR